MKTIVAESMFYQNYEDYNKYGCVSCTLEHWPDMWLAERQADGAIHRDNLIRLAERQRRIAAGKQDPNTIFVVTALVYIDSKNGWKIKNRNYLQWHVKPIYEIPANTEEENSRYLEYEKAKGEAERKRQDPETRLTIDVKQLEAMMGDMMPPSIVTKKHTKDIPVLTRADLQSYVAAQLAGENGWEAVDVQYGRIQTFYRIR